MTKKIKSVDELKKLYYKRVQSTAKPSPLPYKPRFLNMIYANLNGYFWLPCFCGKYFGGHEWLGSMGDGMGGGTGICPECSLKNYNENGNWDREGEEQPIED